MAAGVHAAAAAVLLYFLPPFPGLCVAALIAALAAIVVRRSALLSGPDAVRVLFLGRESGLVAGLGDGRQVSGVAHERRFVSRWLVVLVLAGPGVPRRTILVARDMLAAGEFRHLRLWALWGALPAGGAVSAA